jgi:predicted hydrocarbon binding protein
MVEKERLNFFIMPENALRSLKEELEIMVGEVATKKLLERYGYRCGEELAKKIEIACKDLKGLGELLETLWAEIGLGKPFNKELAADELIIEFKELPIEQSCSFIAGYLKGLAKSIVGESFRCFEESCRFRGGDKCKFIITPSIISLKPKAERVRSSTFNSVLEFGNAYLIKEDVGNRSYNLFLEFVTNGFKGLVITRAKTEDIRAQYNLMHVPILWLTSLEVENAINPAELPKLYHELVNILKENKRMVILLAGIEYLLTHNGLPPVIRFLQLTRDQVIVNESILLLPVNPKVVEEKELKIIESELRVVE